MRLSKTTTAAVFSLAFVWLFLLSCKPTITPLAYRLAGATTTEQPAPNKPPLLGNVWRTKLTRLEAAPIKLGKLKGRIEKRIGRCHRRVAPPETY